MMATIKDVAKQAHVSIATVSHVMNGTRFVSEETKQKVLKSIEDLHYERNALGLSFRKQRSGMIGIIIPFLSQLEFSNEFFLWAMLEAENVLTAEKYSVLVGNSKENFQAEMAIIDRFKQLKVEGIILAAPAVNQKEIIEQLQGIPCVFIDREPIGLTNEYDVILSDSYNSMYEAVTEQIVRGKKNFGIISGNIAQLSNIKLRYEGFKQALHDNNIQFDNSYAVDDLETSDQGTLSAQKLFTQHPEIDSVFITTNNLGSDILQYIKESGRRVPEDVNITLFDDSLWNRIYIPSLTTITQNPQLMGKCAAKVLLKKMQHEDHKPQKYLLKNKLIIRNSWNW